ncbi:MAG TPA: hypothetical protein VMT00_00620 [Thermoanaerobaculia bacterium]|nr:hypothetical protein [Thermoanaerobaculia bacterium]
MKRNARLRSLWAVRIVFFCVAAWFASSAAGQTLTLSLQQDPGGITLSGSGTESGSVDFGFLSRHAVAPSGATISTSNGSWSLTTQFAVKATLTSGTSGSYRLQAELGSSDAWRTWKINGNSIPSGLAVDVMQNGAYDSVLGQSLMIAIPDGSPSGAIDNTIHLTAIAN